MSGVEEPDEAVFIACIQEMDELVDRKLRRYPLGAIIVAMGTCLAGMLGALLDESQCTPDDIRELLCVMHASRARISRDSGPAFHGMPGLAEAGQSDCV